MSEIERLRDELNRLRRISDEHKDLIGFRPDEVVKAIEFRVDEIARLEAEAADPWREARGIIEKWRRLYDGGPLWDPEMKAIEFVDHLTAENDRLAARVAELENEPEAAKVALKRADEIKAGDVILAGGKMRTVTRTRQQPRQWRIECNEWAGWFENREIVAVINEHSDPDDPILDPARVLATAVGVMGEMGFIGTADMIHRRAKDAKPYRLKGGKDA